MDKLPHFTRSHKRTPDDGPVPRWVDHRRGSMLSELFRTTAPTARPAKTVSPRRRIVCATSTFGGIEPQTTRKTVARVDANAHSSVMLKVHRSTHRRVRTRPGVDLVAA
jgi:hypothetical protein